MPHSRWISRSTLLLAGLCTAAALTACGSTTSPTATGTSGSSDSGASSSATTSTSADSTATDQPKPGSPEISDAAGAQLCDMLRPELSNWRVQGPSVGKVGLNGIVHEWALRNGAINGAVLADKPIIDRVTEKSCSDVRQEAVEALEIPDLASGLAF